MLAPEYQGVVSALGAEAAAGRGGTRARDLGVWIGLDIAAAALIGAAVAITVIRSRDVPRISGVNCMSEDLDRTRPVWRQVAAVITARIAEGVYPVGGKVPSVVELSTEFGIAASTAQKALTHLKAEGLIRTEVGLGSFVAGGPS
ncbi:winged helix-turn-helix domain-containing protein [Streptomyces sp. NPDC005181]|uniref:GntR family transcriptional regulator n=1 Tax=Streptomyces sp. NPDC005181 TaxID=3156869 RepID=UPI0033A34604